MPAFPALFRRHAKDQAMSRASKFIRAMHPKTEIRPEPAAMRRVLDQGWWGQVKIHGHRLQLHLSADPNHQPLLFNRQGNIHRKKMPQDMVDELRRILPLREGWSAFDAEWVKEEGMIYLFDYLKMNGEDLSQLTYEERYQMLPRVFVSPCVKTLPVLRTVDECLGALSDPNPLIEGLVFKSRNSRGFRDQSIVRCRKKGE